MENQERKVNKILYSVPFGLSSFMPIIENTFFAIFLTDAARLSSVNAATVLSLGSTLIIIATAISGVMIQKIHFKHEKYRPWFLIAGISAAILSFMKFTTPGFSASGLVFWFIFAYVGTNFAFGLSYSAQIALMPMIAKTPEERVYMSSLFMAFSNVAGILLSVSAVYLVAKIGNGVASRGYSGLALIIAVLVIIGYVILYVITKGVEPQRTGKTEDKKEEDTTKVSVWQMIKYSFINKPMLFYFLGTLGKSGCSLVITMTVAYYYTYVAKNLGLFTIYLTASTIMAVVGSLITPLISKMTHNNRSTFIVGLTLYLVTVIFAFFAKNAAVIFTVLISIGYMGWSISQSADMAIYSTITDYVEYKYNKDLKGFIMGMYTFIIKVSMMVASSTVGISLAIIGYDAANVTEKAISGIIFLVTVVPAIYLVIGIVGMRFFPITDDKQRELQKEIAARKN